MGLFSFTQELAMDLGTANSIIVNSAGKILLDEPSIVALDRKTEKMIALGEKARQMHGKTHENIRTVRPLRDGVIADFNAAEQMIREMIKMANKNKRGWFSPSLRVVICIPSGSTEVEIRAVRDSAEHAGGRDVFMIFEPMAAALGIGLDVEAPEGNMIVDIGGGTTEIAVISLGGIVSNKSIKIAGDDFTEDIQDYMGRQHNIKIGDRTAEQITFDTDPDTDRMRHLNKIVLDELENIATNGPRESDFSKVKEYMNKSYNENLKENRYWLNILDNKYFYGEDMHTKYLDTLNSITRTDIQNFVANFLKQGNVKTIVMLPNSDL
jgi:MreB/Mrl family cell shape determining protein